MEKPSGFAAYAKHLSEWDSDELFNAAKAMEDLQVHPGWAVLKQLAEYRTRFFMAQLDPPHVHEQAGYASLHGMRSGVQQTVDIPEAVRYAAQEVEKRLAEQVGAEV